jgi:hypothetical protein
VDVNTIRIRAHQEFSDLGPEPHDPRDRGVWQVERRGAVLLLAALADYDAEPLRRASVGEWVASGARQLLLDAASECTKSSAGMEMPA